MTNSYNDSPSTITFHLCPGYVLTRMGGSLGPNLPNDEVLSQNSSALSSRGSFPVLVKMASFSVGFDFTGSFGRNLGAPGYSGRGALHTQRLLAHYVGVNSSEKDRAINCHGGNSRECHTFVPWSTGQAPCKDTLSTVPLGCWE
jgi:hypothetical protein